MWVNQNDDLECHILTKKPFENDQKGQFFSKNPVFAPIFGLFFCCQLACFLIGGPSEPCFKVNIQNGTNKEASQVKLQPKNRKENTENALWMTLKNNKTPQYFLITFKVSIFRIPLSCYSFLIIQFFVFFISIRKDNWKEKYAIGLIPPCPLILKHLSIFHLFR